jgi:hypothetical protein
MASRFKNDARRSKAHIILALPSSSMESSLTVLQIDNVCVHLWWDKKVMPAAGFGPSHFLIPLALRAFRSVRVCKP